MTKRTKHITSIFLSLIFTFLSIICCFPIEVQAASPSMSVDITSGNDITTGTAATHSHLWIQKKDANYHWTECSVCGTISGSKQGHTWVGNGGSKTNHSNYYNNAFRYVCSNCGQEDKPWMVFHGRYANFTHNYYYKYADTCWLTDRYRMTQSEANTIISQLHATCGGQRIEFSKDRTTNDGRGWIFIGGPVVGNDSIYSDGTSYSIGTIELYTGQNIEMRKEALYEYEICKWLYAGNAANRITFANQFNKSYQTGSAYYGMYDFFKNKCSDSAWNNIVYECKGYYTAQGGGNNWHGTIEGCAHDGGYGQYEHISDLPHEDVSGKSFSLGDTHTGTCAICGMVVQAFHNGATYPGYIGCDCYWSRYRDTIYSSGTTGWCPGHNLVGVDNKKLATIYYRFRNNAGNIQSNCYFVLESGCSLSSVPSNWSRSGNTYTQTDWTDVVVQGHVGGSRSWSSYNINNTVNYTYNGKSYSKSILPFEYARFADTTKPYIVGSASISGNGSSSTSLSRQVTITATYADRDQYYLNQLYFRIYDSDQSTLLKFPDGSTVRAMSKTSGSSYTSSDTTRTAVSQWKSSITFSVETSSTKTIYLQAYDITGWVSPLTAVTIKYVDSQPPTLTVTEPSNKNSWSTTKVYTVTATDSSDIVNLGVSTSDMVNVKNSTYNNKRTYTFSGELDGTKGVTFYATDRNGNLATERVEFSKLDNTAPSFTGISFKKNITNASTGALNESTPWIINYSMTDKSSTGNQNGSGFQYMAITQRPDETPNYNKTPPGSAGFSMPSSGIYYLWGKDYTGHTCMSDPIIVNSGLKINGIEIRDVTYNGYKLDNKITYNNIKIYH